MSGFTKFMFIIWGVLALLSFVSSFFAPLYFMIVGIAFGSLNMLILLAWVITYFYNKKLNKEIDGRLQLQETQETSETQQ